MLPRVQLQRGHLSELVPAVLARVGLLTGVQPYMLVEHGFLAERLPTERTPVRSVVGVNAHVLLQMGLLLEALVAVVARVGPLDGVGGGQLPRDLVGRGRGRTNKR